MNSKLIIIYMVKVNKPKKLVMYDGERLFLKRDGQVQELGTINTRAGNITRIDKLKAVQMKGQWIDV